MTEPRAKDCASCGRRFDWRKKWERSWDHVRYCSQGCRRRGVTAVDVELEDAILSLLHDRARGATICPSEAARSVAEPADDVAWRALMEPARCAARRLVAADRVVITQKSRVVDPSTAKGPIRIRMVNG